MNATPEMIEELGAKLRQTILQHAAGHATPDLFDQIAASLRAKGGKRYERLAQEATERAHLLRERQAESN